MGLSVPLTHLSFAKQRFDSTSAPARKYCAMLSAIAVALATIVADTRTESKRKKRAQAVLEEMTPTQIVTAGLWADYAALANNLVRIFDRTTHDVARTWDQVTLFIKKFQRLFVDLHVLSELPAGTREETMTSVAIEQAASLGTLHYADRVLHLWPAGGKDVALSAVGAVREIASAAIDRARTEMPSSGLWLALRAFDLNLWARIARCPANDRDRIEVCQQALMQRALRLGQAHAGVAAPQEMAHELCATASKLARDHAIDLRHGLKDNRAHWAREAGRGGVSPQLLKVIYWYLAVMELTGEVERSLGQLTRTLEAHVGPQDLDGHGVADALEVSLGGPLRDDDLVYARKCEGHAIAEAALGEGTHATLAAILDRLEDDVASRDNIQPKAFIRSCAPGQETPRIRQESPGDNLHPHPELNAPRAPEEGRGHGLDDARNAIHSEAYL